MASIKAIAGLAALGWPLSAAAGPLASPKRGLAFTPNDTTRVDDTIWVTQPSCLTWYYNYKAEPEPTFSESLSQSEFEFVPMMWGAPEDASDTTFLDTIKGLIKKGINITNVLSFNEPDGSWESGGSNIEPAHAAKVWVSNLMPLQEMGIRVGLPATTGAPSGLVWLKSFLEECGKLVSTEKESRNCTYDFLTIHWYGNFEGLASHLGEYVAT